MRPGFVFIGLFALLIAVYALLADSLGNVLTIVLQAAIIVVVLAAALWFRSVRARHGWSLFRDAEVDTPEEEQDEETFRKAS